MYPLLWYFLAYTYNLLLYMCVRYMIYHFGGRWCHVEFIGTMSCSIHGQYILLDSQTLCFVQLMYIMHEVLWSLIYWSHLVFIKPLPYYNTPFYYIHGIKWNKMWSEVIIEHSVNKRLYMVFFYVTYRTRIYMNTYVHF